MFQCNWDWIHECKQLMVKREIEKEKRSKPIFHFFDIIIGMAFYYVPRKKMSSYFINIQYLKCQIFHYLSNKSKNMFSNLIWNLYHSRICFESTSSNWQCLKFWRQKWFQLGSNLQFMASICSGPPSPCLASLLLQKSHSLKRWRDWKTQRQN